MKKTCFHAFMISKMLDDLNKKDWRSNLSRKDYMDGILGRLPETLQAVYRQLYVVYINEFDQ